MTILDVIWEGRAQARTKRHIALALGIPPRSVEEAVQEARLAGAPICSDQYGYWLGTAEEVQACADRLRKRAGHQLITARAMRRTANRLTVHDQATLWSDAA